MCVEIGNVKHPQGRRCTGQRSAQRALTYTELRLNESMGAFASANSTAAPAASVEQSQDEPKLATSWIKRLWEAAMDVQRKIIRLREKRAAVRAEHEAEEAERIAALEAEADRKAAEAKASKVKAATRAYDAAYDYAMQTWLDLQLLESSEYPSGPERRKILLKESKTQALQAARGITKIEATISIEGDYTPSQLKRLETLHRTQAAAAELVSTLETAIKEAPDLATARMRHAKAVSAQHDADVELTAAEES